MSVANQEQMERALNYLAQTDDEFGRLVGKVKAAEHRLKVVKAMAYLDAEGTVQKREAEAYTSETYINALNDYENTVAEKETIGAKRKRAELTIDVWRSINANRRQG